MYLKRTIKMYKLANAFDVTEVSRKPLALVVDKHI